MSEQEKEMMENQEAANQENQVPAAPQRPELTKRQLRQIAKEDKKQEICDLKHVVSEKRKILIANPKNKELKKEILSDELNILKEEAKPILVKAGKIAAGGAALGAVVTLACKALGKSNDDIITVNSNEIKEDEQSE